MAWARSRTVARTLALSLKTGSLKTVKPDPVFSTIEVAGCALRAATWTPASSGGGGAPEIVMLHDGLGSLTQWRSVPREVAQRTNKTVLGFERAGHGESLPTPVGPWPPDWLHTEADRLAAVLDATGVRRPILIGHSDGGSISLLHAAKPSSDVAAVLALAPHSWVEQLCFDGIVEMRANRSIIEEGLRRHHQDPEAIFEAWSGGWVSDEFRHWDIRPLLRGVEAPTLIAQGSEDLYATDAQAIKTAQAVGANATWRIVDDVGHIMHHDDAEIVVDLIVEFVTSLAD